MKQIYEIWRVDFANEEQYKEAVDLVANVPSLKATVVHIDCCIFIADQTLGCRIKRQIPIHTNRELSVLPCESLIGSFIP